MYRSRAGFNQASQRLVSRCRPACDTISPDHKYPSPGPAVEYIKNTVSTTHCINIPSAQEFLINASEPRIRTWYLSTEVENGTTRCSGVTCDEIFVKLASRSFRLIWMNKHVQMVMLCEARQESIQEQHMRPPEEGAKRRKLRRSDKPLLRDRQVHRCCR
jgi:hypothetical protein